MMEIILQNFNKRRNLGGFPVMRTLLWYCLWCKILIGKDVMQYFTGTRTLCTNF